VLPPIAARLDVPLTPGGYVFATIHRAENRTPDAIAAWAALLGAVARPNRPVVLALHPGTRAALDAAGVGLPDDVLAVEPLGYRSTIALQLHAAAVLTDSGGVQRESAWLGVPCLVLRGTTEWLEAVAGSGGAMVVIGLDGDRALAELDRLAPIGSSAELARERAAALALEPAGAAALIVP
jgi:UDP-GlcNAc3NAcA epimerase